MINKKFKKIFFSIAGTVCLFVFAILIRSNFLIEKAQADASATNCDINSTPFTFSIKNDNDSLKTDDGILKVLPGGSIHVTIQNQCSTNSESFNIFIGNYQKISNSVIGAGTTNTIDIPISGTSPNTYAVNVVGFLLNDQGTIIRSLGSNNSTSIAITDTAGVVIVTDPTSSATQGDEVQIAAKFYGLTGNTFTIYVDGEMRTSGLPISADNTILPNPTYKWDIPSDAATGIHPIKIKVFGSGAGITSNNNETILNFTVKSKDTTGTGGGASGSTSGYDSQPVTASALNRISLSYLINTCKGKTDLAQVSCLVSLATSWLLDIAAVVSVIMIIYASIIYLTSYGDENKAELGKKTLIWSVIGILVISLGKVILYIIERSLNNPTSIL